MTKTMIPAALLALCALAACNTVGGAGKDMKSAGTAISKAADRDK